MADIQRDRTSSNSLGQRLDHYHRQIKAVILDRQHPVTGLLPASTAVNSHGNYTDAWVRDNVYSILAVWGLALAYRRLDDEQGYTYELQQSVVKLMRGLLFAMMQQSEKVERFKVTQAPIDALHAKYSTTTGSTVVGDGEWGHLQIDATSLFLLMLAQMTASGLQIVYTLDEVNFIQNLVYYIGRAYRTPDYGIWERGNKLNHGNPELNVSSLGLAKAALEALQGFNLFGIHGGQSSVIHVLSDEIAWARITLESLLPRESGSKEVDAALLSVISFPAFAVENPDIAQRTHQKIIDKLQGRYGCKRFLRDGHQTELEDTTRLHYEPEELQQFEHIECEWPLFFAYLLLDSLFRGDTKQIKAYSKRLQEVMVEQDGLHLLPELYYVPAEAIEAERQNPHSQTRLPNDNVPLVWAQSLYYLGQLLQDGLITPGDIDPLGRHLQLGHQRRPVVQVALLSDTEALQAELATYGISTQIPTQLEPVQVRSAEELVSVYSQVGSNAKLGLTGRPERRARSLATSRVFRIDGDTIVFLPAFLDQQQFYLTLDYHFLVAQIRSELAYIHTHWHEPGRPTVTLLLTQEMFERGRKPIHESPLLALLQELLQGHCGDVPVKVAPLYQLMLTSGSERIDDVRDLVLTHRAMGRSHPLCQILTLNPSNCQPLSSRQEFDLELQTDLPSLLEQLRASDNLYEQIELLHGLCRLKGLDFDTGLGGPEFPPTSVANLLMEVYEKAGQLELWAVVRRSAALLGKGDIGLTDALTELLVRQKQISVGKSYSEASLITDPLPYRELLDKIQAFCGEYVRDRVLTQEILIYLSVLIKSEPELFKGLLTLRVGYLILLLTNEISREQEVPADEAYEILSSLSPFELKMRLKQVLESYSGMQQQLFRRESLRMKRRQQFKRRELRQRLQQTVNEEDWLRWRQINGEINRVPEDFYGQMWTLLQHCQGIVIGDKLERRNRLESQTLLSAMTPGEQNFALMIDHLLSKIQAPEYRHLTVEALQELATLATETPDLQIDDYIVMDVLIGHAVRLHWLNQRPEREADYDRDKGIAWRTFYKQSPQRCATYIDEALQFLIELDNGGEDEAEPMAG
jgi:phosphorylase kinase alpha/beta subunit